MIRISIALFLFLPLISLSQHSVPDAPRSSNRDSSYVYTLPYEKGTCHFLVQGYQTFLSHKGEYALDFKMKRGTRVCAARRGVVVEVKEDSHAGGLGHKYLNKGNHVIIRHEDGTYGHYWHLMPGGALVSVGDSVQQHELIGLSGNTGFSAFPHLHFEVTTKLTPSHNQIPTYFQTRKGIRYLRTFRCYKCV